MVFFCGHPPGLPLAHSTGRSYCIWTVRISAPTGISISCCASTLRGYFQIAFSIDRSPPCWWRVSCGLPRVFDDVLAPEAVVDRLPPYGGPAPRSEERRVGEGG